MISRIIDELESGTTNINGIEIGIIDYNLSSNGVKRVFDITFEVKQKEFKDEEKKEFRFKD